jgi:predicted enzyme related to lactoylglutathione lyase
MITGIDFVALPAADMARARAFYEGTLGLKPGHAGDAWAEFDLGPGPALALIDPTAYGMPMVPVTAGTVAIAFHDFEGMAETLRAQNRLAQPPFESPVCHGGFAVDTEGNSVAIHRRKEAGHRDRVMDFVALPVADMARARAFYEGTLGLTPSSTQGEVWAEYVLPDDAALALGDVSVMGLAFAPVTSGSVGLNTPDVEGLFERLKAQGLALADAVMETPVCFMGFVKDTEGNSLVLHRPKSGAHA